MNIRNLLLGIIVVVVVGFGIGYFFGWYFQPQQQEAEQVQVVESELLPKQEVQLFFATNERESLIQETVLIDGCSDDPSCIRGLVDALIAGSLQGNGAVLPAETKLLSVQIENDLVRLDFSEELVNFHPGGSLAELQTIYSVANSLNLSYPYIRQVQILIAGEVRQTVKGHARIDQPVYADFSFGALERDAGNSIDLSIGQLIEEVIEDN